MDIDIGDTIVPLIGRFKGQDGEVVEIGPRDGSITAAFENGDNGLYFRNEITLKKRGKISQGFNRVFKPGIYTHFKEGEKYLAYEKVIDEQTLHPRIIYFNINNPKKKWDRREEVFLSSADQNPQINKTGQQFKFEYLSNKYPLIVPSHGAVELLKIRTNAFEHLHIGDTIQIITFDKEEITGLIECVSQIGVIINNKIQFVDKHWREINVLYKIYEDDTE